MRSLEKKRAKQVSKAESENEGKTGSFPDLNQCVEDEEETKISRAASYNFRLQLIRKVFL